MWSVRSLTVAAVLAALCGAGCTPAPSYSVRTYPMGDKVQLGALIYTVFDTQWFTHLGDGMSARVPDSRFFAVRFSVTNSGPTEVMIPTMTVTSDAGKSFTELTNGDQVPQWVGFLRRVKPAETLQGNIVFDCSPAHYKLHIADETEQRTALIDLPLTFGSETPEMPGAPAPERK